MRWWVMSAVLLGGCSVLVSSDNTPQIEDLCPDGWSRVSEQLIDARIADNSDASSLKDVPIPVLLSPEQRADLQLSATLDDVRVTDREGKLLDFEIEFAGDDTRPAVVWVRVPTISLNTEDAEILVFGGNERPGPVPSDPAGVWKNKYVGVWHLHSSMSGSYFDSTENGLDGADGSGDNLTLIEGVLGNGLEGTNDLVSDELSVGSSAILTFDTQVSAESWFARTVDMTTGTSESIQGEDRQGDAVFNLRLQNENDGQPKMEVFQNGSERDETGAKTPNLPPLEEWRYYAGTVDLVSDNIQLYENGVLVASDTPDNSFSAVPLESVEGLELANDLIGRVDELRLSADVRSPQWFEIQYKAMTGELLVPGESASCR